MDPKVLAAAAKHFEKFYESEVFADIIDNFASVCELLKVQPGHFVNFYSDLKANVKSCRGINLFKHLDERIGNPIYNKNMHAANTQMVVVGAGPIGLRTAIEAQLLGARVTVMEKRTSFTRNNVLHLWPWVIEDLKSLGAKHFYPRFCTGTMNHISIKRLQCILLKTALCLGVEVFGGVEFSEVVEPKSEGESWKLAVRPENHPISKKGVDVIIGAEGKHVSVPGFRRKEFRGKLAIAITANFKNKRTTAEAVVEEISGVAFVYKQDFFNNLYEEFGIALENIVYYKDDTHYFVMTTKKHSLLDRQVLKKDLNDPMALLNPKNINKDKLLEYIRDACDYCTDYQLPHLEFALNHHGEPDVALFDFTSMFASASACHVMEKMNKQLLFGLVGDGLLEPFWPTGTGIARGFLGAFDAVWMVRQWAAGEMSPIEIMEERESILKLLPQTTPENITKDYKNISIVPKTRYPNLPKHLYSSQQVRHLYQSDTPANADLRRFQHPGYEEVMSKLQLKRSQPTQPESARMRRDSSDVIKSSAQSTDANANDFYQAMREKRRNDLNKENTSAVAPVKQTVPSNKQANMPTMTLKEKIEARRAALEKEDFKGTKSDNGDEKSILKDVASKADFVRKMSKTFGYGMPSNAESKPDAITTEAEKCALLVKSSKNRESNANVDKPRKKKSGDKQKKSKTKPMSRDREPVPSNERCIMNLNNNNLPPESDIIPELDIEIDPELDFLLAELEQDEDFSKLCENDQKAWLESLFYQDTKHLSGRIGLNPTKANQKQKLRLNQDNANRQQNKERFEDDNRKSASEVETNSVHVNDKMKDLTQNFFKKGVSNGSTNKASQGRKMSEPTMEIAKQNGDIDSDTGITITRPSRKFSEPQLELSKLDSKINRREKSPSVSIPSPTLSRKSSVTSFSTPLSSRKNSTVNQSSKSIDESCEQISGINESLCSLAQSYFQKPASRKTSVARVEKDNEVVSSATKEDDEKASLVASFFGSNASKNTNSSKNTHQANKKVQERVSYEPQNATLINDEEDDEIERLIMAAEKEREGRKASDASIASSAPPPVPTRTENSRAMAMMKRLGAVTGILQGKN